MSRSDLIKMIQSKNNISISEMARRIGQSPQNFSKKLSRNTVSDDELAMILSKFNVVYEQKISFTDGTTIEMGFDNGNK